MELWWFGFAGNAIVGLAYLAIAGYVFTGLARAGGWWTNPLALATGGIFLSCGLGHGVHAVHAVLPGATQGPAQYLLGQPHVWILDGATAVIAIWYFTLRNRYAALVRGAQLFEDMRVRQRQALEIHDNVVQGLVKAKLSLDLGDKDRGIQQLEDTLAASRRIMGDLLGEATETRTLRPGDLRRGSEAPSR